MLGRPCVPSLPTCRSRSTWCCWASPTRRWRRRSSSPRRAVTPARSSTGRRTASRRRWSRPPARWRWWAAAAWASSTLTSGVRAIGYLERDPLPVGSIALVTHSGSVFSAMLRTHRRLDYSVASPPGRSWSARRPTTWPMRCRCPRRGWSGWCSRRCATPPDCRPGWPRPPRATSRWCALTVGSSVRGQALVDAHSGAIAGSDAGWEALFAAYGVHRCADLAELTDSLETFAIGRRPRPAGGRGLATVHDSGAERVLVADVAERLGVPFADLAPATIERLTALLDPGLEPTNPLDVWGSGADTEDLFGDCAGGARRRPRGRRGGAGGRPGRGVRRRRVVPAGAGGAAGAHRQAGRRPDEPAVGGRPGRRRRACGRSGSRCSRGPASGLRALGHLLGRAAAAAAGGRRRRGAAGAVGRRRGSATGRRCSATTASGRLARRVVTTRDEAVAAADATGYPVVLKTAEDEIHHKTEADGVRLGLGDRDAVGAAYDDLAARLGPRVLVQRQLAGVEVALGIVRDPLLGPLVVVAAGGTLVELVAERAVALPPVDRETARAMVAGLRVARLLDGYRGSAAGRRRRPRRGGRGARSARRRARRPARGRRPQPGARRPRRSRRPRRRRPRPPPLTRPARRRARPCNARVICTLGAARDVPLLPTDGAFRSP